MEAFTRSPGTSRTSSSPAQEKRMHVMRMRKALFMRGMSVSDFRPKCGIMERNEQPLPERPCLGEEAASLYAIYRFHRGILIPVALFAVALSCDAHRGVLFYSELCTE